MHTKTKAFDAAVRFIPTPPAFSDISNTWYNNQAPTVTSKLFTRKKKNTHQEQKLNKIEYDEVSSQNQNVTIFWKLF